MAALSTLVLTQKVAALEGALEHVVGMHQANMQRIIEGFGLNDLHIGVMQMILCDVSRGEIRLNEEGDAVAFYWYQQQYSLLTRAIGLVVWLKKNVIEKTNGQE